MKDLAIEAYNVILECQQRILGFSTFRYMFAGKPSELRGLFPKTCTWIEDDEAETIGNLTKK